MDHIYTLFMSYFIICIIFTDNFCHISTYVSYLNLCHISTYVLYLRIIFVIFQHMYHIYTFIYIIHNIHNHNYIHKKLYLWSQGRPDRYIQCVFFGSDLFNHLSHSFACSKNPKIIHH